MLQPQPEEKTQFTSELHTYCRSPVGHHIYSLLKAIKWTTELILFLPCFAFLKVEAEPIHAHI